MSVDGTRRSGAIGLVRIRPPLSRDEEAELHEVIADGRAAAARLENETNLDTATTRDLRRRVRLGRQGEEELLSGTCALVRQRVRDLGFRADRDDLEAAGLEGLVKALREFDPTRSVRFATYANYWISKMVYGTIAHRVHVPDADLRLVVKYRRLNRHGHGRTLTVGEVATALGVARGVASRIMRLSDELAAGDADLDEVPMPAPAGDAHHGDAEWVIDALREVLGSDFADFWMWTGKVMSLEELGQRNGVSKQAMSKRARRWRRQVEESRYADDLVTWLRAQ